MTIGTSWRTYDPTLLRPPKTALSGPGKVFDEEHAQLCSVCTDFPNFSTPDIAVTFEDLITRRLDIDCPTCSVLADAMQNFAPEGTLSVDSKCTGRKPSQSNDLVELNFSYNAVSPVNVNCVLFRPAGE
jgi:hypothetical protein